VCPIVCVSLSIRQLAASNGIEHDLRPELGDGAEQLGDFVAREAPRHRGAGREQMLVRP